MRQVRYEIPRYVTMKGRNFCYPLSCRSAPLITAIQGWGTVVSDGLISLEKSDLGLDVIKRTCWSNHACLWATGLQPLALKDGQFSEKAGHMQRRRKPGPRRQAPPHLSLGASGLRGLHLLSSEMLPTHVARRDCSRVRSSSCA